MHVSINKKLVVFKVVRSSVSAFVAKGLKRTFSHSKCLRGRHVGREVQVARLLFNEAVRL
jgi:hypothetical protein